MRWPWPAAGRWAGRQGWARQRHGARHDGAGVLEDSRWGIAALPAGRHYMPVGMTAGAAVSMATRLVARARPGGRGPALRGSVVGDESGGAAVALAQRHRGQTPLPPAGPWAPRTRGGEGIYRVRQLGRHSFRQLDARAKEERRVARREARRCRAKWTTLPDAQPTRPPVYTLQRRRGGTCSKQAV